ncbi:hypothetical protein OIDMADRAFT_39491 [Oidiodendron maius Zn]|uniref:Carboxypeptidase n=1 Tax=Oidiodendron maius (strain Zn) TaxID=913774 RepID=A0A0C3D1K0_OIDMZ|nr:hypothetical protein OIDMADRAFT_39491 [Oidiodendron maius Zn]
MIKVIILLAALFAASIIGGGHPRLVVNGSAVPDIPSEIGESYAGLLPISQEHNETRQLYFWSFPSDNVNATDEIAIWINGGPGCSSMTGLIHENGPILWQTVTQKQPVGVGFIQDTPDISNEVELSQQFVGFWKNFITALQLRESESVSHGESYAGFYIPYVADTFIEAKDNRDYNLKGVAINDPIIGDAAQKDVIMSPLIDYWAKIFNFNETFTEELHSLHASCGHEAYISQYLKYPPPKGPFPIPPAPVPCFNRIDVQAAINAPVGAVWQQCTILDRVIEYTNNAIIGVGNLDYILPTNGTLLALQNMIWHGEQGIQSYPGDRHLLVPYHREQIRVDYAEHQQPQYAPNSSYRVIEMLLDNGATGLFLIGS